MSEKEVILTIKVPDSVKTTLVGHRVTFKGKNGEVTRDFKSHRIKLEHKGDSIVVIGSPANKQTSAVMMTLISHIKNMIEGLNYGYKYTMKISYSHFPMTAELKDKTISIKNFLGEKYPRVAMVVGDAKVAIKGTDVTITGHDLETVSQTAANIEQAAKVRGRDIRRFTDGIYVTEKGNIDEKSNDFKVVVIRGRE